MGKLIFAGHETFHCKNQWLKKGYDFVDQRGSFNDESAVINLGVGKNMVASIRFWMKAFRLIDDTGNLTTIANKLFNDATGYDKFLEDKASIWLLHYLLVSNYYASIYYLTFVAFHRKKNEFDITSLESFIKRECEEQDSIYTPKTVEKDINVLIRNYVRPSDLSNQAEEFSNLLIEINLIERYTISEENKKQIYAFNYQNDDIAPFQILLFCILEQYSDNTIDFQDMLFGDKGLGLMFCLTSQSLDRLLTEISSRYEWAVYSDDAGIKQLQIKQRPCDNWAILDDYYNTIG